MHNYTFGKSSEGNENPSLGNLVGGRTFEIRWLGMVFLRKMRLKDEGGSANGRVGRIAGLGLAFVEMDWRM